MSNHSATIQPPLQGPPLGQGAPPKLPAAESAHADSACSKQCRLLTAEQGLQPRHLLRRLIAVCLYQQLLQVINSASGALKISLLLLPRYQSGSMILRALFQHMPCSSCKVRTALSLPCLIVPAHVTLTLYNHLHSHAAKG